MKLNKNHILAIIAASTLLFGLKCTQTHDLVSNNIDQQNKPLETERPSGFLNNDNDVVKNLDVSDIDELGLISKKRLEIKKSAQTLTSMFKKFKKPEFKKADFLDFLIRQGLQPEVNIDEVDGLENLSIIRTSNALKGIRYIHAQYTGESNEDEILQHLSFELRPSKTAFKDAKALLAESFPELDQPLEDTADSMVIYKYEGYVVWIKELDRDDVRSDPFNPRTSEDVGSVKIAIEYDIHPNVDHD